MDKIKFSIFFLLFIFKISAFETPVFCKNLKNEDCNCDVKKVELLPSVDVPSVYDAFKELNFIHTNVKKLNDTNFILKKKLGNYLRTLRDGAIEPTYKKSMIEIKEIQKDFDFLTTITIEIERIKNKYNVCINNCSKERLLELDDSLIAAQKLKISVLLKNPILSNQNFESLFLDLTKKQIEDGKVFSTNEFQSTLKDALVDNLQTISKKEEEYTSYLNDLKQPLVREGNEALAFEYNQDFVEKFPSIVEEMIDLTTLNSEKLSFKEKKIVCAKSKQYEQFLKNKKIKSYAIDASLLILPLLTGPFAPVTEATVGARLIAWGIKEKEFSAILKNTSKILDLAFVANNTYSLKEKSNECLQSEIKLHENATVDNYDDLKKCHIDYHNRKIVAIATSILMPIDQVVTYSSEFLAKLNGLDKSIILLNRKKISDAFLIEKEKVNEGLTKGAEVGFEFQTPKDGFFTVMNLSKLDKAKNSPLYNLPEKYWNFVARIYQERLNLSFDEIRRFVKSSLEASKRTKVIINTEDTTLNDLVKFRGGVGIVESKSTADKLPLEKATTFKINRKPNEKVVEIVRLSVSKDIEESERTSQILIDQALKLAQSDSEVSRAFIYTSKVHARLYRRFGVPVDKIKNISDRDVIIELNREDVKEVIRKMKEKREIKSSFLKNGPTKKRGARVHLFS